jgi:hypothetical protein
MVYDSLGRAIRVGDVLVSTYADSAFTVVVVELWSGHVLVEYIYQPYLSKYFPIQFGNMSRWECICSMGDRVR